MEKLTAAVTKLLEMQIAAGADAVQIFDSLGGLLPQKDFAAASAKWMKQIISALGRAVPVIVFSKDIHGNWDTLVETGANVLGIDSSGAACRQFAKSCRRQLASRAIWSLLYLRGRRRKLRRKPNVSLKKCAAREVISLTSAMACRRTQNWKVFLRWWKRQKISNKNRRPKRG